MQSLTGPGNETLANMSNTKTDDGGYLVHVGTQALCGYLDVYATVNQFKI